MKSYRGTRTQSGTQVTADGQPLQMKSFFLDKRNIPFDWGNHSDGAGRLALSVLVSAIGEAEASFFLPDFIDDIVSKLSDQWQVTSEDIREFRDFLAAVGYAAQEDETIEATGPIKFPRSAPLFPPRILVNPNYHFESQSKLGAERFHR